MMYILTTYKRILATAWSTVPSFGTGGVEAVGCYHAHNVTKN